MGGRSYVELAPGITYSNCMELTGWQQLLGRKHQAPTPVFIESLLCGGSLQQNSPSAKFRHLCPMTSFTQQQTAGQLGSRIGRVTPHTTVWFKHVWELYRQPAIIKPSVTSCLKDRWFVLQTLQKGPTALSSQHHAGGKNTVPMWKKVVCFSAGTLVSSF